MSGAAAHRKRLIKISAGSIRNSVLPVTGHLDFFPDDAVGPSRRDVATHHAPVVIRLDGLPEPIETDIPSHPSTGRPTPRFRNRSAVRAFYEKHGIQSGDVVAIERLDTREYRLYPFHTAGAHDSDWHTWLDEPLEGDGPTVLELFAGCGGMAQGFKQAGFQTALAVEWDADACASLRKNVTQRVAQCAIEEIDVFPKVNVVSGGPPCQGFSNLGEVVPYDPRRQLWRHFIRAVEESKADAFVMENVAPLLKSQEFVEIEKSARTLGFEVDKWILNTADYGVPQTRRRAIVIGLRGAKPTKPPQTHVNEAKRTDDTADLPAWVTVEEAIGDLPKDPDEKNWHIGRNPTKKSKERYAHITIPGGNRWDLPVDLMPNCWKKKTKGGTDLFGRLWPDRPSVTIRTEFYKPEKGRYLHYEHDRPITHREAARLQGFDDAFDFQGKRIAVGRQIGNAMPPPFAKVIAEHVQTLIARVKQ